MAVPGVGSGVMGSMITAGLKGLASNLAAKTATAKGNVLKGLKGLREKGVVKKVFRSMAMVGLTTSILGGAASAHPNTDIISELTNRVITATTKSMLYAATGIVIGGEKPSKALQSAYKSAIAHTLCSTMAGRLGKAYHAGQLPNVIHEGLHGLVGVMGAKIQNRSALAGAVGAISGEVFGKLYSQNSKVFNNPNASPEELQKAVDRGIELAEITAASVATLFKLDADVAANAAQTAVQENAFMDILQHLEGDTEEYDEILAEQQVSDEAKIEIAKELLNKIKDNPAAFFKGCADISTDMIIPGGNKHIKNLLNGKEDLSTFATNQKRSIGEEIAMGMMVGGKLAKGSKKFKAVVKYVDGKYQAKLANIKIGKANAVNLTNNKTFTQRISWTAPAGTKQNYRIYQRNDIDWNMIRTKGAPKYIGKTNREACLAGRAPQLSDGKLVTLHHIGQNSKGPLVEASTKFHNTKNKQAFKALHNQYGGKSHPKYPVNHDVRWNSDRENYWKWRAKNAK